MNYRTPLFIISIYLLLLSVSARAQTSGEKKNPADAGRGLRLMMLNTDPKEAGVKPSKEFPRIYGVLMDWPIGEQTATILSTSTGAASVYTTSTFGIIGGESHVAVREAAMNFVKGANRYYDASVPTTKFPYPAADRVRFYFLTYEGVRVIETDLGPLSQGTSEYEELFGLGQRVLSELRKVAEK